ncbi:prolipoprotein diacylglyceryl transferase [Lutispora saccharofermentans]|uniref:Phosphatidylglycerol--prolipoprotein diacylglyceryl transferase n=1 Tax=Lutispora saccharofermentans TaxID=3024236 RepID=A0ABT1NBX9_9FIRM|nr:prolipoprotein diacylglyceryl transferase [Lutispora saccharofermentans]MCQ1528139.1 prolipoprotein diacylglyceryl transferase [Lutispora saccharofermentans]
MNPVAFDIFGISIRWYGILISMGMLLGIFLAYYEAKKQGYNPDDIIDLSLWVIPAALIGARLYYVAFQWEYYKGDILKILNTREGGLAVHGGLIAAVLVGYFFTRAKNMPFWKTADIVAPSIALGQAIGRWGNFINGEAYGGPTDLPWGIMVDGVKVHPAFLYESIWDLGLFIFLIIYRRNKKFNGEIFLLYAIIYSAGRFWIEGLRTDSLMFMGMRTAQLISIAIIAFGLVLYFIMRRR